MTDLLPLAGIGVYSTDLGFYLTAGIYLGLMQWLVWSIARHSADIELWRTGAFCLLVGSMTILGLGMGGLGGILSAAILGFLCGWVILGYVFELETWQRAVMTAVGPVAAIFSFLAGYWLKGVILTNIIK
ncbi:MAG: hypothetical protein EOP87_18850 [Verrucomicrobiaceae bacterium]|nr:MAG: hypothetical protein EOP87_18850 [Verrucomicrobiaceae bacterium]